MTVWSWVMVGALGASALLVGLGWMAFWPSWPPLPPGDHRTADKPWKLEDQPIPEVERPAGKGTAGRHRPSPPAHGTDTMGGGTVRLWPHGLEPPMARHVPLLDEAQRLSWPDEVPPPRSLERDQ